MTRTMSSYLKISLVLDSNSSLSLMKLFFYKNDSVPSQWNLSDTKADTFLVQKKLCLTYKEMSAFSHARFENTVTAMV